MAIATLNPLFESITGRMGNVVFYRRGNTQCIRSYVVPGNPDTACQRKMRRNFANAVKSWQILTADKKYSYTRKARNLNMSGYNLFISEFIKGRIVRRKKYSIVCKRDIPFRNNTIPNNIHSVLLSFQQPDRIGMDTFCPEYG